MRRRSRSATAAAAQPVRPGEDAARWPDQHLAPATCGRVRLAGPGPLRTVRCLGHVPDPPTKGNTVPISLEKIEQTAPELVSLAKKVDFAKSKHGIEDGDEAAVVFCIDFSGSMSSFYSSGLMQKLTERILTMGLRMDDDGSIPMIFFGSDAWVAGEVSMEDYKGSINRLTAGKRMGSTNYAAAMKLVREMAGGGGSPKKRFGFKKGAAPAAAVSTPTYVVFVTDGEPDSRPAATKEVVDSSGAPIFWQFVGIGTANKDFLVELDDMGGRVIDNADYFNIADLAGMNDQQLFDKMLTEYPAWLKNARAHGIVA